MREGHSPDVPGEGSLFNVSPLLPTMLEDFDDSVLGDPISYARFEQFPGSESLLSLPVYAWPQSSAFLMDSAVIQTVLDPGKSDLPAAGTSKSDPPIAAGEDRLLETGLPGCPYRFLESSELPFTDGNPAYGLQLHHPRLLELVGAPESAQLLDCSPSFWVEQLGKEQAMTAAINLQWDAGVMLSNLHILSQFEMAMNRMSFSMMALGLSQSLFLKVAQLGRSSDGIVYVGHGIVASPDESGCSWTSTSLVMPLMYELQILFSGGPAPSGVTVVIAWTCAFSILMTLTRPRSMFCMLRHY